MTTFRQRRWLVWLIAVFLSAGLVSCWVDGEAILARSGAWLDVGLAPVRTDYVLVLPGQHDSRPYVAAALVKAGYAGGVILLKCKIEPDDLLSGYPPRYEIEKQVLLTRGVPEKQITVLETATTSTFSDAQSLQDFLSDRPSASAAIVTCNYHTRRARYAFRQVFGDKGAKLLWISAPTDGFSPQDWWRHKRGLKAYFGEVLKLAFYCFRYGQGLFWAMAAALVIGAIAFYRVRGRPTV